MSRRRPSAPHPYRAREDDSKKRIAALVREIERLRARITPRYLRELRVLSEMATELDHLEALSSLAMLDEEGRRELERLLTICRDELLHAIEVAPEVEANLRALPRSIDQRALGAPWPEDEGVVLLAKEWTEDPARARSLSTRIAAWVGKHDAEARIVERGGVVRVAPFAARGAPLALEADDSPVSHDVHFKLATPMARGVGELEVVPKQWLHEVTSWLRLDRDTLIGDRLFDDRFMVRGELRTARQLLSEAVRADLLDMARDGPVQLTIAPGVGRLEWVYIFASDHFARALRLLGELRHARITIELLR